MARTITLQSDLGAQLRFVQLQASEALGRPYRFVVETLCSDKQPDLAKLLGTPMAVVLAGDGADRLFHGIVAEVEQQGWADVGGQPHARLAFVLMPRPWLLAHRRDCRIHAGLSVPQLVRGLLHEIGYSDVRLSLSTSYPVREYCVQYRESTLDFIGRLLEQEGIYYYFEHSGHAHTLVLADGIGAHARRAGYGTLAYVGEGTTIAPHADGVGYWRQRRALHATAQQLDDYDPLRPRASLLADEALAGDGLHGVAGLHDYDWGGNHVTLEQGRRYAQVRAEAHNAERAAYEGQTRACGLAVGQLFALCGCPEDASNQDYLVVAAETTLREGGHASGGGAPGPQLDCTFHALESRLPFRSVARTPWPRIAGLQSAVVAGERDEDIAVDQYGRVTVDFHWSTSARGTGKVSCPVRVASAWAGKGWGLQALPRVGQEVLVGFLDGDPDRPLIVGSVYNADHMPPYALPDARTQSGIRSRSHPDGGADAYNELRFDDRSGEEDFLLHAQKDMHVEVEHDQELRVEHDQRYTIDHDQTGKIKHDRRVAVDNEDVLEVGANATHTVRRTFKLDAGSEIELVTGASSLVMTSAGEITLKGVNITLEASSGLTFDAGVQAAFTAGATMDIGAGASAKLHSDAVLQLQGGASAELKAPMLTLSGDALAKLAAALVMIG